MAVNLHVNGSIRTVAADAETPLLYVLRNDLGLNGAKFGCRLAQCGACTVLIGGRAVRSCVTPIGSIGEVHVTAYVAVIAEVEVDRSSGAIRVPRVFAATDASQIINPDGLRNQIEGGIIQSTSWTLHEAVRFDRAAIQSRDWSSYPILTMPEVPTVEVELIDRPEERALGCGEASLGPTVAAIANAFARATGKRIRDLPLDPARVKAALGRA
jgi:CO/xanthine dehydrogenase Mo-binding subunit